MASIIRSSLLLPSRRHWFGAVCGDACGSVCKAYVAGGLGKYSGFGNPDRCRRRFEHFSRHKRDRWECLFNVWTKKRASICFTQLPKVHASEVTGGKYLQATQRGRLHCREGWPYKILQSGTSGKRRHPTSWKTHLQVRVPSGGPFCFCKGMKFFCEAMTRITRW